MQTALPVALASVTLLPETSARSISSGRYRPHIVLEPVTQDSAAWAERSSNESYLGVAFIGGPAELGPGETAEVELALMYYPSISYEDLKPGATFTLREGTRIVGFGRLLSVQGKD